MAFWKRRLTSNWLRVKPKAKKNKKTTQLRDVRKSLTDFVATFTLACEIIKADVLHVEMKLRYCVEIYLQTNEEV